MQQTPWPGCPLSAPYEPVRTPAPRALYSEYSPLGLVLPSRGVPCYHNMVEKPSQKERRKQWLDRSIYDLVEAHNFLALTDQRLLGWYLSLTPEDRTIIQADGGFNQFLHRHPLLELSRHHVYVKYIESFYPTQPTATRRSSTPVSQCSASGATTYRSDLEMLHNNLRETLTLLGCSTSGDGSRTRGPNHQQVHTVTGSSHLKEPRPSCHVWSSSAAVSRGPAAHMSVSPSPSERPTGDRDTSSQYYSFDSIHMDDTERCDRTIIQERVSSALTPAVAGGRDHTVGGNDRPAGDDEAGLSFESQSESFHSIMENDESILACVTSKVMTAHNSVAHSGAVTTDTEAPTDNCETLKSDRPVIHGNTAEKSTSPVPCVTTCDHRVGTEPTLVKSAGTQTEGPETADKHVITEVHMSDLDYLAEEFIKLKAAQEKRRSPNISSVLQNLESDCNRMRDKILAEETTGASVVRAQVVGDVLDNVPSGSQQPQKPQSPGGESGWSRNGCQHSQRKDEQMKMEDREAQRAPAPPAPQDGGAIQESHTPEERMTAAGKELSTGEAWYDAEEHLQPSGAAAERGPGPTGESREGEEVKSSVLCVSNLPSSVTESDVMQWFEKHPVCEVSVCAFRSDFRVAVVMISGPAEAAARELHGRCVQGRTLHVEHINGAPGAPSSIRGREASPDQTLTHSSSCAGKLMKQPPLSSSVMKRAVVCISPTAKGTCVPQHFGTMGSFDTLMSELTRRHPGVGRQRIVDALMELKAEHRGALSGLPLRTIRDMTSELLTRPAGTTAP